MQNLLHVILLLVAAHFLSSCATRTAVRGGVNLQDQISITVNKLESVESDEIYTQDGFFGYPWGTPFWDVPNLRYLEGGVALVFKRCGEVIEHQIQDLIPDGTLVGPCRRTPLVIANGIYIMSSYYREYDSLNADDESAVVATIFHFCSDSVKTPARDYLRLCGGDLVYRIHAPDSWEKGDQPVGFACRVKAADP